MNDYNPTCGCENCEEIRAGIERAYRSLFNAERRLIAVLMERSAWFGDAAMLQAAVQLRLARLALRRAKRRAK